MNEIIQVWIQVQKYAQWLAQLAFLLEFWIAIIVYFIYNSSLSVYSFLRDRLLDCAPYDNLRLHFLSFPTLPLPLFCAFFILLVFIIYLFIFTE